MGKVRKEFELFEEVKMKMSEERGVIIGVAHYAERPSQYYVRYKDARGSQVEVWWEFKALVLVEH